jgi:hypothetical protein
VRQRGASGEEEAGAGQAAQGEAHPRLLQPDLRSSLALGDLRETRGSLLPSCSGNSESGQCCFNLTNRGPGAAARERSPMTAGGSLQIYRKTKTVLFYSSFHPVGGTAERASACFSPHPPTGERAAGFEPSSYPRRCMTRGDTDTHRRRQTAQTGDRRHEACAQKLQAPAPHGGRASVRPAQPRTWHDPGGDSPGPPP